MNGGRGGRPSGSARSNPDRRGAPTDERSGLRAEGDVNLSGARARFLEVHPEAAAYASFADFDMWRIEVVDVRWVGGFGRMEWVSGEDYRAWPSRAAP